MQKILHSRRFRIFLFTLSYIIVFSIGFTLGGNYEFLIYTFVMLFGLFFVTYVARHIDIPNRLLWLFSFMGILHMAGGGVHVNGNRLYAYTIVNIYHGYDSQLVIFKYDQLVHLLGYGVIAVVIHHVLRRSAPSMDVVGRALLSIGAAMGIGSFNEMAEFTAVLTLPSTGVGDYANTILDLSFNTLGAIIGVCVYEVSIRLKRIR